MLRSNLKPSLPIEKSFATQKEMKNINVFVKKIKNFQKYLQSKLK